MTTDRNITDLDIASSLSKMTESTTAAELVRRQGQTRKVKVVCTLEDHVLRNGFGAGVIEQLSDAGVQTPVVRIGWPDQFIEHATTQDELRHKYGLSVENTVAQVRAFFGKTAPAAPQLAAA